MWDLLDSVGVCSLIGINYTTYLGLIIVVVGAFLEIVGYLALDFGHSGIDPLQTRQERLGAVLKLDEVWWEGRHH